MTKSYSRSKKPKRGRLRPHPRDACVGPARAAPAMPSPTSTVSGPSSCLGETCGQNHLLPQREHFHPIVTSINTRDCKNPNQTNRTKKGCWERRLCSPQSTQPVAAQSSALWATKARAWAFPFSHMRSLDSAPLPKTCPAPGEGGAGGSKDTMWYLRGPPWLCCGRLPEFVCNATFISPYIPQSKVTSRLRKRLNWQCPSQSCAFGSVMNPRWALLLG